MEKNYIIRIPSSVKVFYFFKKSLITFKGPSKTESFKVNFKLSITKNVISIEKKSRHKTSNKVKKALKFMHLTAVALLKQSMMNSMYTANKKLKLVGVGYRIFEASNDMKSSQWFTFKLGYSHLLYFKLPRKIALFCVKFTTLFLYGSSYINLTETCSRIRSYKSPEPYKGKGVLYFNEVITLKEGKKI